MNVKIKKIDARAIIPSYSKLGDAGMDLTAIDFDSTEEYIQYRTGLAIEIPEGFVGLIFPRSSISKYSLVLANSVGVIDSGYRGEILVRFKIVNNYQSEGIKVYKMGERIAQLMIVPYPVVNLVEVDGLSDSVRGEGGFGSSN